MTNENAIRWLKDLLKSDLPMEQYQKALEKGIEALEPSGDLISREETLTAFADYVGSGMSMNDYEALWDIVAKMPSVKQEPKTGHCKDCKWWKDSDGVYRRGIGAESKCPINNVSVNHGLGYCYMFEPQESEDK